MDNASPNQEEVDRLRELLSKANEEIKKLKTSRFDQLELQELSIRGAGFYASRRLKGIEMTERTKLVNALAHGIFMGWRKCEAMRGVPPGQDWETVFFVAAIALQASKAEVNNGTD